MKNWWQSMDWVERTLVVVGVIPISFCLLFDLFIGLPLYIFDVVTGR